MGGRGHNAGGFCWMARATCPFCKRQFVIGNHNPRATCVKCLKAGKPRRTRDMKNQERWLKPREEST